MYTLFIHVIVKYSINKLYCQQSGWIVHCWMPHKSNSSPSLGEILSFYNNWLLRVNVLQKLGHINIIRATVIYCIYNASENQRDFQAVSADTEAYRISMINKRHCCAWNGVCREEMSAPKAVLKAKTKPVKVQTKTTIQEPKLTCAMDTVCIKVVT